MMLWSIWRSRNLMVWEATEETIANIIHSSFHALQKWLEVQEKGGNLDPKPITQASGTQEKLPRGFTKHNIDASFSVEHNKVVFVLEMSMAFSWELRRFGSNLSLMCLY